MKILSVNEVEQVNGGLLWAGPCLIGGFAGAAGYVLSKAGEGMVTGSEPNSSMGGFFFSALGGCIGAYFGPTGAALGTLFAVGAGAADGLRSSVPLASETNPVGLPNGGLGTFYSSELRSTTSGSDNNLSLMPGMWKMYDYQSNGA